LTDAELRLMDVLWERGAATVTEVMEALPASLGLAYNTVLTTLRILESKKYLRHTKAAEGRAHIYKPLVGRQEAGRNALRYLTNRFFRNSATALVVNLLNDEKLDEKELQHIRKLLAETKDEEGK
jgi:predicted transcriptional regulator